MNGRPIEELNAGVTLLKDELSADPLASKRVQIAVVTFGPVETVTEFVDAGLWTASHLTSTRITRIVRGFFDCVTRIVHGLLLRATSIMRGLSN